MKKIFLIMIITAFSLNATDSFEYNSKHNNKSYDKFKDKKIKKKENKLNIVNFNNYSKYMREKKARYLLADKGSKIFKDFKTCTIRAKTRIKIDKCEEILRKDLKKLNMTAKNARKKFLTKE